MSSNLFKGTLHSALYSKFRPSPPDELINFIIKYCKSKIPGTLNQAIDVGCGSGQSTVVLAPYFNKVTGFDVSEAQVESAANNRSLPNVEYKVADCVNLPLKNSSVELITSSQSAHWFNFDKFYPEVNRILVPNGVIAFYGYMLPSPQAQDEKRAEKITAIINNDFYEKQLGIYWNKERHMIENHYRDIPFPFKDVQRLDLVAKMENSLSEYIGYLSTWSAYQKLHKEDAQKAEELLQNVETQLMDVLQLKDKNQVFPLHSDFFLLIGHS